MQKKPGVLIQTVFAVTLAGAAGCAFAADQGAIPCDGVQQDRAACLREAGAAKQEAKTGGLHTPAPKEEDKNALARCAEQPAAGRADCEARVRGGSNTTSQGSVLGGGIVRETVTPAPAR